MKPRAAYALRGSSPPDLVPAVGVAAAVRRGGAVAIAVGQPGAERPLAAAEGPSMPTRARSISGRVRAAARIQRPRSGRPASPRFGQPAARNVFARWLGPRPSIWTTINPGSACSCVAENARHAFGPNAPYGRRRYFRSADIFSPGGAGPDGNQRLRAPAQNRLRCRAARGIARCGRCRRGSCRVRCRG